MKILNGIAWSFDSQYLVLKTWTDNTDPRTESFNTIHLWIQVWNLPNPWISKDTGFRFRNLFSEVIDVMVPESGSKKGRYISILAEVDLNKSLLRGTKIRFQGQTVWVEFKYEKLVSFCFNCGRVGRLERSCLVRTGDAKAGQLREG